MVKQAVEYDQKLKVLAKSFLDSPGFSLSKNKTLEGYYSGRDYKMDFLIENQDMPNETSKLAVKVLDFKKPAGTDVINKYGKAFKDINVKGLLISNNFSKQAISLAKRTEKVILMNRSELTSIIETSGC